MSLRPTTVVLVLACLLSTGCSAFGWRQTVDEARAREVLATAVGLAASGQADRLCTLSPNEASTCVTSLRDAGAPPSGAPSVRCGVPAPEDGPLRNGWVLVLDGQDAFGDSYTTEFVVYDDGRNGIGVLDAVYWSGLSIRSYTIDTVTWGFDSASTTCERGELPVQAS